jgi:hypothetical protein
MQVAFASPNSPFGGVLLRVKVLTGASPVPGASAASAAGAATVSVTTTKAGSLVYGGACDNRRQTAFTWAAGTAELDDQADTGLGLVEGTWKSAAATIIPGPAAFGTSDGNQSGFRVLAGLEVLPAGTLAEDSSSPASVYGSAGVSSVQTADFTPPAGSLLAAVGTAQGDGGTQTTGTVSGGSLTWTEQIRANPAGAGYVGVWTAYIPVTSPVTLGDRVLMIALTTLAQWAQAGRLPDIAPGQPFWALASQQAELAAAGLATLAPSGTSQPSPVGHYAAGGWPGLGKATANSSP